MTKIRSLKHEKEGDIRYIRDRHSLLMKASHAVTKQFKNVKHVTREDRDYAFHRHMTVLCIEIGIMDPGNLVLFDAKELPTTGSGRFF